MKYRTTHLFAETSENTAGTETIPITVKDIISRIVIAWRVTKSKYGMDSYMHSDITKIELVDGSDVLFSMDGGECQALCIYDRRCPTMNHGQILGGNSQYSTYGIDFGRFLHDPELAFDPTKFRNPQLKITHNLAVSDTGVSAAWLEVWAECFDEKIVTPVGFLMSKEYHSWSITAADTYHYVDLPTDYPIRKMLIQGYAKGVEPWYQVAQARLDEENEKRIPFDWDLEDYYRTMKGSWTPVEDRIYAYEETTGIYAYYLTPSNYYGNWAGAAVGTDAPSCLTGAATGGLFTLRTDTLSSVSGIASGYLPNHCFEFPFGDQMDLADWYDVTKLGNLRLRLKSGSATSGSGNVILQQLRRY